MLMGTMDAPSPAARRAWIGLSLAACLGVIAWRAVSGPPERLWRDWPALLAAFACFSLLTPERHPVRFTGAFLMILALGLLYLVGHVPNSLAAWDLLP
jgi:hypothetical protein